MKVENDVVKQLVAVEELKDALVKIAEEIQKAVAAAGHARFQKVDTVPAADEAVENVLYLVMNSTTGHYDIYALVGGSVERLDDTTVDMSGYVEKVEGKGLSTEDYTTTDKEKVSKLGFATNEQVQGILKEVFGS